jgi:hypothetical protein
MVNPDAKLRKVIQSRNQIIRWKEGKKEVYYTARMIAGSAESIRMQTSIYQASINYFRKEGRK